MSLSATADDFTLTLDLGDARIDRITVHTRRGETVFSMQPDTVSPSAWRALETQLMRELPSLTDLHHPAIDASCAMTAKCTGEKRQSFGRRLLDRISQRPELVPIEFAFDQPQRKSIFSRHRSGA